MSGTDTGPLSPKEQPSCLFAISVNPLAFCPNPQKKGKIFCEKHVGKKEFKEVKK